MFQRHRNLFRLKQKLDALEPGAKKLRLGQIYFRELDKQNIAGTIHHIISNASETRSRIPRGTAFIRVATKCGWIVTDYLKQTQRKHR